jgi:hypothetical protein
LRNVFRSARSPPPRASKSPRGRWSPRSSLTGPRRHSLNFSSRLACISRELRLFRQVSGCEFQHGQIAGYSRRAIRSSHRRNR